jgi:Zn-dependent M28 family amino/carboxypeptidase
VKIDNKLTFSVASSTHFPEFVFLKASIAPEPKKLNIHIENKFIPNHTARNVIGYLEGTLKKDSFVVIAAHYDHLGKMGKDTYFPGANDNASGVAMLLELAHFYAQPENRLPYTVVFIAFAAEEAGLVGSKFFTENPLVQLPKIRFMLNLDLMGSGKEGIAVVNGLVFKKEFAVLDSLNKSNHFLPLIKPRGKAANSDHFHFSEKGVPSFFIYTMGEITAYHDVDDKPEVVTFSKFKECFWLLTAYLRNL